VGDSVIVLDLRASGDNACACTGVGNDTSQHPAAAMCMILQFLRHVPATACCTSQLHILGTAGTATHMYFRVAAAVVVWHTRAATVVSCVNRTPAALL
jgi:hypothetical protein